MIELFRKNATYYVTALSLIVVGLVFLLFFPKGELVLLMDTNHTEFLDILFCWVTKGGEFYAGSIIAVLLLIFSTKRSLAIFGTSIVLSLLISQGLKHLVFADEHRPYSTYTELHDIEGLERHQNNSFPSGHTTAAFTFFTAVALTWRYKWLQLAAPFCAASVGISRVYLGQHYFSDIVVGAILGVFIVSITVYIFDRKWPPK